MFQHSLGVRLGSHVGRAPAIPVLEAAPPHADTCVSRSCSQLAPSSRRLSHCHRSIVVAAVSHPIGSVSFVCSCVLALLSVCCGRTWCHVRRSIVCICPECLCVVHCLSVLMQLCGCGRVWSDCLPCQCTTSRVHAAAPGCPLPLRRRCPGGRQDRRSVCLQASRTVRQQQQTAGSHGALSRCPCHALMRLDLWHSVLCNNMATLLRLHGCLGQVVVRVRLGWLRSHGGLLLFGCAVVCVGSVLRLLGATRPRKTSTPEAQLPNVAAHRFERLPCGHATWVRRVASSGNGLCCPSSPPPIQCIVSSSCLQSPGVARAPQQVLDVVFFGAGPPDRGQRRTGSTARRVATRRIVCAERMAGPRELGVW